MTTTALITGATQGLGAETAARLAERGWTVWLGAREQLRGEDVANELRAAQPDADLRVVQLDVTSDGSVAAAYDAVVAADTGLDVLVNNAGVSGDPLPPPDTTADDVAAVFEVNVLGPVRVTHRFLPLLRRADRPRLVMVSSSMGSFASIESRDPDAVLAWGMVYPASKAALNMMTTMYAKAMPGVRVTAVAPGFTATNLNGYAGTQTVEVGAEAIVRACVAEELPATFVSRTGVQPW
jgi:NAD(P)-dependent dehydrogenase (short-subunit alcohol dehydrogenase family)